MNTGSKKPTMLTKALTMTKTTSGRIRGSVTKTRLCQKLAPSTWAASTWERGTPFRPARKIMAYRPVVFQMVKRAMARGASCRLVVQRNDTHSRRPSCEKMPASTPLLGR